MSQPGLPLSKAVVNLPGFPLVKARTDVSQPGFPLATARMDVSPPGLPMAKVRTEMKPTAGPRQRAGRDGGSGLERSGVSGLEPSGVSGLEPSTVSGLEHSGISGLEQDLGSGLVQDLGSGLVQDGGSGLERNGGSQLEHSGRLWGRQHRRRHWGDKRRGESLVEHGRYLDRVCAENVHRRRVMDFFRRRPGFLECGDLRIQPPPEHLQDVTRHPLPDKHVGPLGQAIGQVPESALESLEDCWVHYW